MPSNEEKEQINRDAECFIRRVANTCASCLNDKSNCESCFCFEAKILLERINANKVDTTDYTTFARYNRIIDQLKKAGQPMLSKDIFVDARCYKQLKQNLLNGLCKRKIVRRFKANFNKANRGVTDKVYYYSLNEKIK